MQCLNLHGLPGLHIFFCLIWVWFGGLFFLFVGEFLFLGFLMVGGFCK